MPSSTRRVSLAILSLTASIHLARGQVGVQDDLDVKFQGRIDVAAGSGGTRSFSDIPGQFRAGNLAVRLDLPLGPARVTPEGNIRVLQFFSQVRLATAPTEIGLPGETRDIRFLTGSLLFGSMVIGRRGNTYLGLLGATIAEDEDTLSSAKPLFSGIGLGTYVKNPRFSFIYGGAVSYPYSVKFVSPLFGVRWQYHRRWELLSILPFLARTTYIHNRSILVHILLAVSATQNRLANMGEFAVPQEAVFLQTTQLRLGAQLEYRPTRFTSLLFELGTLRARELDVSTGRTDGTFLSSGIDPAGYIQLFWRWRFGKQ